MMPPSGGDCCAAGLVQTLSYALRVSGCGKWWYFTGAGSAGSISSHRIPTFKQSPTRGTCSTDSPVSSQGWPLNPIFMLGGAPKAHEVFSITQGGHSGYYSSLLTGNSMVPDNVRCCEGWSGQGDRTDGRLPSVTSVQPLISSTMGFKAAK